MQPFVVDLTGAAVLSLSGPDARRFANGMFTQNLRDLPVGEGARSAWCDDRGRLLGLMDVYAYAADGFVLVLEGVDFAAFEERFAKFVVFDDIEMVDRTDGLGLLTVQGPGAAAVIEAAGFQVPTGGWVGGPSGGVGRRDRTGLSGFDLLLPRGDVAGARERLGAMPAGVDRLEVLRVEAGLPRWPADMGTRAFPHEMGLRDAVLHFSKGCYVGQEIINRMDSRGQVRRALAGLRLEGDQLPPAGAGVVAEGKQVGAVTSPVRSPDLGLVALSVQRKPWHEPGTRVQVVDGDRSWQATVVSLPMRG